MKSVLITGGNGFIGSHLGELLAKEGRFVTLLDLRFDWHSIGLDCNKVVCDVLNRPGIEAAAEDVDAIIHLAAVSRVEDGEKDPQRCMSVNVEGTKNVVNIAAKGHIPLVLVSSREVYGNATRLPITEGSQKRPLSMYARSKLEVERLATRAREESRLQFVILRLSNVYGSVRDREERVIPTFVRQASAGQDITIHGGSQSVDFTFVDDVVRAISQLALKVGELEGEDYNIVTGHSITVNDLALLAKEYTNSRSAFAIQGERGYFAHEFAADPTKINGFLRRSGNPTLRPVEEGLGIYVQRVTGPIALGLARG
jgi:UDP-glucose 4-epimerase